MGRVLFVLDIKLTQFLRVVIAPGLACYAVAGLLAWPAMTAVAAVNRWQGAGVLFAMGLIYLAGLAVVLHRFVLTNEEKQKVNALLHRGLGVFGGREVTA
jgi:hypothetical protein